MSALRFHKLPHSSGNCHTEGCNRSGRYKLILCDYVVPADNPLKGSAFIVCGPCQKREEALWQEADAPFRGYEGAREAMESASTSERVHAIFELRELGCGAEDVEALKVAA